MIREGLMRVGQWDLRLRPDTPRAVRAEFDHYWQIVVTPSRVPGTDASRADAVANARYRGPLLEMSEDRTRLSGAGMMHYLTWSENANPGPPAATSWDWSDYLLEMETNHFQWTVAGLTQLAVVDEPAAKWPATTSDSSDDLPTNMFDELLYLAGVLGCEFYVTPDRDFHSGGAGSSSLFTTTPQVILVRNQDGRDLDLIGLSLVGWDVTYDTWDHANRAEVLSGPGSATSTAVTIYNAEGTESRREVLEVSTTIDNVTDADNRAEALLAMHEPRRTITVSVDTYDIGRWIKPGDYLWAFDPVNGVVDTSEATFYHGMHLTPAKLRLYEMRWPVQAGMGVYLLNADGSGTPAVVDLTDYVVWEDGATTLEVDAPQRAALDY